MEPFGFATQSQGGVGGALVLGGDAPAWMRFFAALRMTNATAILFVAQGYDGIDADGAAGWEVAG